MLRWSVSPPVIKIFTVRLAGWCLTARSHRVFFRRHPYSTHFKPVQLHKMQVAYFQQLPGDELCQISFHLVNGPCRMDKIFNFRRSIGENIEACLDRIRMNIEKELTKRNKKTSKKCTADDSETSANVPAVKVQLINRRLDEGLPNMTVSQLLEQLKTELDIYLVVMETDFRIHLNAPEVQAICLPSSVMADFCVYPSKLEFNFATELASTFGWYRGQMPKSNNAKQIAWEKVGEGLSYMVKKQDIGYHLKLHCIPKNDENQCGPETEVITTSTVQAGPEQCPFEVRHLFTQSKLTNDQLRVVSYNILADYYADSDYSRNILFGYCLPYCLHIDYRKQLIIKEIVGYNANIICLQEVDKKIFHFDLLPILKINGLTGNFRAKGSTAEGLATFYDTSSFELLEETSINIGENIDQLPIFAEVYQRIQENKALMERIVNRSTTVQVTVLRSRYDPKKHLIVANTHLYYHPDADHIRLLQAGFAMLYVRDIYDRLRASREIEKEDLAIIFCGDFNSVPENGIYKLMTEGFAGADMPDWHSNEQEAVRDVSLSQPYRLKSACGCPEFTNFTVGFTACIDYIFYHADNLRASDAIPLPSTDDLTAYVAIPSPVFPSDHIALVANLEWNQKITSSCSS